MRNKKLLAKIIFVAVLIVIILYTFRDSMDEIAEQLRITPLSILAAICVSSVTYHLFEGWIIHSLAKRYNPSFRYRSGVYCAFYCSFYRLSTLGSGAGVAAIVCLGRNGVSYSEATGLYMVQYMIHKVSIAVFSGVFFLINWSFMAANYREYAVYLILAYLLTAVIAAGLILFAVSAKFHRLILALVRRFNKSGKLDSALHSLEENCVIMEKATAELLKDFRVVAATLVKNLIKLGFWYCIPCLILFAGREISLLNSFSVTSLSVMTAAVIPTPAGIGALELVMTNLFGVFVDLHKAAAVTVLYRLATFIFPFAVGGVMILIRGFVIRRGKKFQ